MRGTAASADSPADAAPRSANIRVQAPTDWRILQGPDACGKRQHASGSSFYQCLAPTDVIARDNATAANPPRRGWVTRRRSRSQGDIPQTPQNSLLAVERLEAVSEIGAQQFFLT